MLVVGPVGIVKKPSVFCEALFKLLWESALFADFQQQRQFPQALFSFFLLLFSSFVPRSRFPQRNFAPASPRNDDRQLARPIASPALSLLKRISLSQSRSPLASDSPTTDAGVRDCKK